jgi:hypothetical protein
MAAKGNFCYLNKMKANPDKFQAIVIGKLEAQSALS